MKSFREQRRELKEIWRSDATDELTMREYVILSLSYALDGGSPLTHVQMARLFDLGPDQVGRIKRRALFYLAREMTPREESNAN